MKKILNVLKNIKSEEDIDQFLAQLNLPWVESQISDRPITDKEVIKAIGKLNAGKSPGCDSITAEFYKKLAQQAAPYLVASFNKAFGTQKFSVTQCLAIVILLFKKGDKLDTSNYRLISLTNVDYKILAYVLVNRIKLVLEDIISPAQTAYMPGRFIGTNIRKVQDTIDYASNMMKNGLFYS